MHMQGREYKFNDLSITVVYFANELDDDFLVKEHKWPEEMWPSEEEFHTEEDFIFRSAKGVLLVGVSNLSKAEMQAVNELVQESQDDRIRLLICTDGHKQSSQVFDAVIQTTYDPVDSIYDLALSIGAGCGDVHGRASHVDQIAEVIKLTRSGFLISHWDNRKNKSLITPSDLFEEWSLTDDEVKRVVGIYTWLNPANGRWTSKTLGLFSKPFDHVEVAERCEMYCASGVHGPEYSRRPAPDVVQLLMVEGEKVRGGRS